MLIDLTKDVEIKEISEIALSGYGLCENCRIEMAFNKEALIGWATNLIWTYDEINNKKSIHIHVDPLGDGDVGNQAMGFFLTPQSPSLVVQVNEVDNNLYNLGKGVYLESINVRPGIRQSIEVKDPACDESIEEYELGLNNIADIKVLNQSGEDISSKCVQMVLKINYETLKQFATMLFVLANNYSYNRECRLANIKQEKSQCNMGIIFAKDSPEMVIKCEKLGCVYDYKPDFGKI